MTDMMSRVSNLERLSRGSEDLGNWFLSDEEEAVRTELEGQIKDYLREHGDLYPLKIANGTGIILTRSEVVDRFFFETLEIMVEEGILRKVSPPYQTSGRQSSRLFSPWYGLIETENTPA